MQGKQTAHESEDTREQQTVCENAKQHEMPIMQNDAEHDLARGNPKR
jgi:hypothetical protein